MAAFSFTRYTGRALFFEGDSITAGGHAGGGGDFVSLVSAAMPAVTVTNYATSGADVSTLASRAATTDSGIATALVAGKEVILHVFLGANDIAAGTGATFLNNLRAYIDARRAAHSDLKIVVATALSKTADGDGGVAFDIERAIANPGIRAWLGSRANAISDFAADARIGANGAATNLTYFDDGIHPINAGHAIMGPIATAAINAAW